MSGPWREISRRSAFSTVKDFGCWAASSCRLRSKGPLHSDQVARPRCTASSSSTERGQARMAMTSAIVAPMCAYTLLLFGIWALLGYVRVSGSVRGKISDEYLRVGQGPLPPAKIVDVHHHFSNQFEVPVLFYLGCLTALVTQSVDGAMVTLAWSFVALRVIHTALVLVKN